MNLVWQQIVFLIIVIFEAMMLIAKAGEPRDDYPSGPCSSSLSLCIPS